MSGSGQLRSYLASRVSSDMDCDRVKRSAWRSDGNLVLMHDQISALSLDERRFIEQIATRVYGLKLVKG